MKLTLPLLAGLLVAAPLGAQNIKINLDPAKPADTAPAAKPAQAAPAAPAAQSSAAKQELIVPADGKYSDVQKMEMYGFILADQLRLAQQVRPLIGSEEELVGFLRGIGVALASGQLPYDYKLLVPQAQSMIKERSEIVKANIEKAVAEMSEKNTKEATAFLATLDAKAGVKKTASGLRYEILQEGKGAKAKPSQTAKVSFKASFINGEVFDSTENQKGPSELDLAKTVPGLAEGLQLVGQGGKIKLYIPAELAYGNRGPLPPGALTIFEFEILEVKDTPPEAPAAKK
jgi:FKBP-type peptidyl-prolyl cis-trans isomerase